MRSAKSKKHSVPFASDKDDELGIHPALARRARKRKNSPPTEEPAPPAAHSPFESQYDSVPEDKKQPTIELSPSLVDEGAGEAPSDTNPMLPAKAEQTRALSPKAERRASMAAHVRQRQKEDAELKELPPIAGYRITGVVGKGAMGRVYRAIRLENDEEVAVKVLAPELAVRSDFIARFEREAAALRAVNHSGVVSVTDRGSVGETHYFIMPFIEGSSLRRIVAKGAIRPVRALNFARQIASALGAAHGRQVIHRDLKPENIIVTTETDAKGVKREKLVLVDFGLAGMGQDDPHPNLTKSRMTMGTVNYMAPEQRTDAKRVGPQADLYALGVILYELLTGDLPLGRFKLPTERASLKHLPVRIDHCLGMALDRDPEKRYASAASLDDDLRGIERELLRQSSEDTVIGEHGSSEGDPTEIGGPSFHSSVDNKGSASGPRAPSALSQPLKSSIDESFFTGVSRGPRWITSPPWVKRPMLVWGALALLLGGGAGLLVATSSNQSAASGQVSIDAFLGPARASVQTSAGTLTARTGDFSTLGDAVSYVGTAKGAHGNLALATQASGPAGKSVTGQARLKDGEGVIGFVRGDRAVVFGVDNGRCVYQALGAQGAVVSEQVAPCDAGQRDVPIRMTCRTTEDVIDCQGLLGERRIASYRGGHVPNAPWTFVVGCRQDASCAFTRPRSQ